MLKEQRDGYKNAHTYWQSTDQLLHCMLGADNQTARIVISFNRSDLRLLTDHYANKCVNIIDPLGLYEGKYS